MQGKTVIVVAHRLSTIAHLDRILVFDQGRIVEDGTHEELLALGGSYHRLWSRQAGGFVLDDGAADRSGQSSEDQEPADADAGPEEIVGNDRRRIQRRIY
jgi:ATP-binding cassette subfamily B protein